jgi:hypothetical protein
VKEFHQEGKVILYGEILWVSCFIVI